MNFFQPDDSEPHDIGVEPTAFRLKRGEQSHPRRSPWASARGLSTPFRLSALPGRLSTLSVGIGREKTTNNFRARVFFPFCSVIRKAEMC